MKFYYRLLSPLAKPPQRMSRHSAGYDLSACLKAPLTLKAGAWEAIPTGLALELPEDCEAQIRPRSGLALKHGLGILNSPGTIDADYRGELKVILINHGKEDFIIEPGMRVCQMVISRYIESFAVEKTELNQSARASGGFGSTGH